MKKLEEQWRLAEEQEINQKPDFILPNNTIIEVVSSENEEQSETNDQYSGLFGEKKKPTHAYDGELNAMTFNHVKSSNAFTKKAPMFDVSLMD
jgi:ribonuclease D